MRIFKTFANFNELMITCLLGSICFNFFIYAYDASPKCYQYLQSNFFAEKTVFEAFSLYHIPQSAWPLIYRDLSSESKKIRERVLKKASILRPNPLDPVFLSGEAHKMLLEILYESFSQTLRKYGVANDTDITAMFQFIRAKEAHALSECLD